MGNYLPAGTQPGNLMALSTFYFMIKKVKLLSTQDSSEAGIVGGDCTELNSNFQSIVFTFIQAKS